jgi:hypothetical protein
MGLARTRNCTCAISIWSRSFATVVPRPHHRPSSGERPLDTSALPTPFSPYRGKPPYPGFAARLSFGEPWPPATVESMMDLWIGHPCVVHSSVDRVHAFFHSKINPYQKIPATTSWWTVVNSIDPSPGGIPRDLFYRCG